MTEQILSKEMIKDVIKHMNDDHADACLAIVQTLGKQPSAIKATMSGMDSLGAEFTAYLDDASMDTARVIFDKPITRDAQIRGHLVAMTKRARASTLPEK